MPSLLPLPRRHLIGMLLVSLGVVAAFLAADPRTPDPALKPLAYFVSVPLHNLFLIGGIGVLLFLAWREKSKALALRVVASVGTETVFFLLAKGVSWFGFHALARPSNGDGGFPSGHTAASVVVAWLLSERFGAGWSPLFYSVAATIAWSRVGDGAHYAYQVLGGAVLGFVVAWVLGGRCGDR